MPRPTKPPFLNPRQAKAALCWSMQKQREVHGWTGKQTAEAYGCSPARISRVEHGQMPSRWLVQFYDETFEADGLLTSLYETVVAAPEQERRRAGGHRPELHLAAPGDASKFLGDTIPNGELKAPGEVFVKSWQIQNVGTVPWIGRKLGRQGPKTGPGLITSKRSTTIPDTRPGETAEISIPLKAPTYACCSIAYFKMIGDDGRLSFPDNYQLGLEVIVLVREQLSDAAIELEFTA
jgi:transcriptional regulator with XRE-family HTH domain